MSKSAKNTPESPSEMPFEEALKKLESIVESMESDDLPLESLLASFEQGTRLAQICQTRLSDAELKIQQLEQLPSGQVVAKPLPLGEEPESED